MDELTKINLGIVANDGQGDTLRAGGETINNNFEKVKEEIDKTLNTGSIATQADIAAATGGKVVDAAGLVQYFSSRKAVIYPNGGTQASPASVDRGARYEFENPFPGHDFDCRCEVLYNGNWGFTNMPKWGTEDKDAVGIMCGQHNGKVVVQVSTSAAMLGPSAVQGNTFNIPQGSSVLLTQCKVRVKVWVID